MTGSKTGGRSPGQRVKDYSQQYEQKMSGMKWVDVARRAMANRRDLQNEFGGLDYDSLDPVRRQQVWNRIRQGVTNYAKREGKPIPSEVEIEIPPEDSQRTP